MTLDVVAGTPPFFWKSNVMWAAAAAAASQTHLGSGLLGASLPYHLERLCARQKIIRVVDLHLELFTRRFSIEKSWELRGGWAKVREGERMEAGRKVHARQYLVR